jgi:ABC-type oligopeptide transport system substrate-binding subunit
LTLFSGNWYTSRTIRKLLTLALAATVLAAACTGYHPTPTARRGGELVVALGQDAQSLNPLVAGDVWSVRAYTPLFPQLYEAAADLTVRPSLAAALPSISGDRLTWTVTLRRARWSDGRPITADDVVYTVETEMDPTLDTRAEFDWSPLKSVERVDGSTVRFHLNRPDAAFLGDRLLAPIVPKHALQGVALASMSTAIFSTQPSVSGGPFRLRLRQPGVSLGMSPNGNYFGAKPYLDTLSMLVLSDQTQLETQIAQGNVGWAPDIPASVAAQLRGVTGVTVRSFPELGRYSLVFNTRAGRPFANVMPRLAVAQTLDRNRIAAAAGGVPVTSGINAASWGFTSVATAGDGTRGVTGELLIPQGDAARAAAAAEIARETALTVKPVTPEDFRSRLRSGDFDTALAGLGEGVDPDPALDVASWETPAGDPHGHNFAGLADAQLDALLKQDLAADPSDHAARKPLLLQIEKHIAQTVPFVDLWTVNELDAFGASLVNAGAVGPQLDQGLQSSFYARWSLAG